MNILAASAAFLILSGPAVQLPSPKPTKEHTALKAEEGVWDGKVKMFPGPGAPVIEGKSLETVTTVCNGLHSTASFTMEIGTTKFEGHSVIGYNPLKKEYTGTWVDTSTIAPTLMTGKYDADKKTMTMLSTVVDAASGQKLKQKQITTMVDDNTKKFEIFFVTPQGDVRILEINAKKRKEEKNAEK
jgi:hypothetical protein